MNRVILTGNLTRDPELTVTPNGVNVCKFTLAVQRRFSNADGEREADFINIVTWRGQAENCHRYLHKGDKAGIVGSIQIRSYDDKDGVKRYVTEINADEVEFLNTRNKDEQGGDYSPKENTGAKRKPVVLTPIEDDSLPF